MLKDNYHYKRITYLKINKYQRYITMSKKLEKMFLIGIKGQVEYKGEYANFVKYGLLTASCIASVLRH